MNRRVRIIVAGRVQGVGFRAATTAAAERMGVLGWVANRRDGQVEIEAQGTDLQIKEFLDWCRRGPPWARVDGCDVEERPCGNEWVGFTLRHGYR